MYLHHILGRNKEELTRRVFNAQKDNPTPGDFIELVKGDTWHVTYDMWHVTCGMWHMMGGEYYLKVSAPQLLQFGSDSVLKILKKRITQWMNKQLFN